MATGYDSTTQQLQELVCCSICLDYYQDPRVLPCSHTFCLKCIYDIGKSGKFTCPLRDGTVITEVDIEKLPINRAVNDVVGFLKSINPTNYKSPCLPCDNCDEKNAINWCDQCNFHFCESCTELIHSIKALRAHRVVSLLDKMNIFCSDHPEEKFKYWCNKCELLVCRDCLLFKHKDHEFASMKDAALQAQRKFQSNIEEITRMKQNLNTLANTKRTMINEESCIVQEQKDIVEKTFASLRTMLDERKRTIIQQLENNTAQTVNALNQRLHDIDQYVCLITARELCIEKTLKSNDPLQILKLESTLSTSEDKFIKDYRRIGEDYSIQRHFFRKNSACIESISKDIAVIGTVDNVSSLVTGYNAVLNTLNISKPQGSVQFSEKNLNYARGYKFLLKHSLQLHSIEIQSDYIGKHIGYVVDGNGIVKERTENESNNSTMKRIALPLSCPLNNNDSIIVCVPSGNGSFAYKSGDNQVRIIDQNCSVSSICILSAPETNIDSKLTITSNICSIEMTLITKQ